MTEAQVRLRIPIVHGKHDSEWTRLDTVAWVEREGEADTAVVEPRATMEPAPGSIGGVIGKVLPDHKKAAAHDLDEGDPDAWRKHL